MAAKPMMARSPSGNRLGTPCAAICAPPTPEKRTLALACAAQRGDQRRAQPVAGFLARHQKDMRAGTRALSPCAAQLIARSGGTPTTKMLARSAACDQLFRLGDDGGAGRRPRCRQGRRARHPRRSAGRSWADRSADPVRAWAPSPARRCRPAPAAGRLRAFRRRARASGRCLPPPPPPAHDGRRPPPPGRRRSGPAARR